MWKPTQILALPLTKDPLNEKHSDLIRHSLLSLRYTTKSYTHTGTFASVRQLLSSQDSGTLAKIESISAIMALHYLRRAPLWLLFICMCILIKGAFVSSCCQSTTCLGQIENWDNVYYTRCRVHVVSSFAK